jgi:deoxyribonuclease-4
VLLETTAGQGTSLGWRFEHLAEILSKVRRPERLGVCFDTCHVFAAGYPLAGRAKYERTMERFDLLIGLEQIKAFHLNDSAKPLGSRIDRHAHIGQGALGLAAFRLLLRDPRFSNVPMYLETPKGKKSGEELDVINLRVLRGLAGAPQWPAPGFLAATPREPPGSRKRCGTGSMYPERALLGMEDEVR